MSNFTQSNEVPADLRAELYHFAAVEILDNGRKIQDVLDVIRERTEGDGYDVIGYTPVMRHIFTIVAMGNPETFGPMLDPTSASFGRDVVEARDTLKQSWGLIASRVSDTYSENKIRRTYREAANSWDFGQRINHGGRFVANAVEFYRGVDAEGNERKSTGTVVTTDVALADWINDRPEITVEAIAGMLVRLSADELKARAGKYGLSAEGKKAELATAIAEAMRNADR